MKLTDKQIDRVRAVIRFGPLMRQAEDDVLIRAGFLQFLGDVQVVATLHASDMLLTPGGSVRPDVMTNTTWPEGKSLLDVVTTMPKAQWDRIVEVDDMLICPFDPQLDPPLIALGILERLSESPNEVWIKPADLIPAAIQGMEQRAKGMIQ